MKGFKKTTCKILLAAFAMGGMMAGQSSFAPWLGAGESFAAPSPQELASRFSALRTKARSAGGIPVIIQFDEFNESHAHAAVFSKAEEDSQLSGIKNAQEQIHKHLTKRGARVKNIKKFKHSPYMAVFVDEEALTILQDSPLVLNIMEDKTSQPALASTTPLINVNANTNTAWKSGGLTGRGQTIAIIDSGVDKNHEFLQNKVVAEACYSTNIVNYTANRQTGSWANATSICPGNVESTTAVDSGIPCNFSAERCEHGTHVAGIAAGRATVAGEANGVAPDANIISITVGSRIPANTYDCDSTTTDCLTMFDSDQLLALERVYDLRNQFTIAAVNMSLGGGAYLYNCDEEPQRPVIDKLRAAGIPVIASSGNGERVIINNIAYQIGYSDAISSPACISSAVSVGATNDNDTVAQYSNVASFLSLLAPGTDVRSSVPDFNVQHSVPHVTYSPLSGTSMAAPHVAGAWAIRKEREPNASVDTVLDYFRDRGFSVNDNRINTLHHRTPTTIEFQPGTVTGMRRLRFANNQELTISKDSAGSITSNPTGINCGSTCSEIFTQGTNVTLSAKPNAGYMLSAWGGACTGTAQTCTVAMTADKTVTAAFAANSAPAAPTGLTATAVTGLKITLNWTDNANNEKGFKIERSPLNSTTWTQIGTTAANIKTYTNSSGLTSGVTYRYRVRAYNNYNTLSNSAYSNTASAIAK